MVESLEAALWAFYNSDSFEKSVLKAVNLGDDADTTGAVCGQIAGVFYGKKGIPQPFLEGLCKRSLVEGFARRLFVAAQHR